MGINKLGNCIFIKCYRRLCICAVYVTVFYIDVNYFFKQINAVFFTALLYDIQIYCISKNVPTVFLTILQLHIVVIERYLLK